MTITGQTVMVNIKKPIMLHDQTALELVEERAKREHRTKANALVATVIESLEQQKKSES